MPETKTKGIFVSDLQLGGLSRDRTVQSRLAAYKESKNTKDRKKKTANYFPPILFPYILRSLAVIVYPAICVVHTLSQTVSGV